ncbi:hypothetical protein RCOM_1299390 [Ricinus communis]|uniref:Uncharacterized protein n=1 Tax=Ricinus communis TaxID=3988 RepID=B9S064_RICCO|nr:hypothetical protein RCOM_1299390 [Ricinus communis]
MDTAKLKDYHAANDLLPEFDDSGALRRQSTSVLPDAKLFSILSNEAVYSSEIKESFMRKVFVFISSCSLPENENLDSRLFRITLMYAADEHKCVSVEFVFEQSSISVSNMQQQENLKCSVTTTIGAGERLQEKWDANLPHINRDDTKLLVLKYLKEIYVVAVCQTTNEQQREDLSLTDQQIYELLTHFAPKQAVLLNGTPTGQPTLQGHHNGGGNDGAGGGYHENGAAGGGADNGDGGPSAGADDGDGGLGADAGDGDDDGDAGGGGGGDGDGGGDDEAASFVFLIPICLKPPDDLLVVLNYAPIRTHEQPRQNVTRETVWAGYRVIFLRDPPDVHGPQPVEENNLELDFDGDWAHFKQFISVIIVEVEAD